MSECSPDILDLGMQRGEEIVNFFRLLTVILTGTAVSAWMNFARARRKLLLFLHWMSGLIFAFSQAIMCTMVLNCWSTEEVKPVIYFFKFTALASGNLFSLSDLALTIRLAQVIE
ncbi:unnamed protein product, partial [Choristocarpus tenellus]